MHEWLDDLARAAEPAALVTVAGVRGSAPRETGATMLVTRTATIGTIGGGQLEYQCARLAVEKLLAAEAPGERRFRRRFPLGSNCGQCCGGVVDVMFERVAAGDPWVAELARLRDLHRPVVLVTPGDSAAAPALVTADEVERFPPGGELPPDVVARARQLLADAESAAAHAGFLLQPVLPPQFNVAVFGAGHVGAATVDVLARLDCRIRWIDGRRGIFPAVLPRNVTAIESGMPAREVAALPPGSYFLVMTHSHPLDFEICAQVLRRRDAAYCGLIGSLSKRRRFERDLRKQGLTAAMLEALTCPIGIAGVTSKQPADIAIAVAAELLQTRDAAAAAIRDNAPAGQPGNGHVRAI